MYRYMRECKTHTHTQRKTDVNIVGNGDIVHYFFLFNCVLIDGSVFSINY